MVEFSRVMVYVYTLWFVLYWVSSLVVANSNSWDAHDAEEEDGFTNPLHPTYYRELDEDNPLFKVEHQGAVLRKHVQALKNTHNKQVEVVFLVDSSASVGANNFRDELKFVKKLLSDFTVDENNTRVSLITFSSRSKVIRHVDYVSRPSRDQHKCSLLQDDLPRIRYTGGGTYTLGAFREAKKVLRHARPTATKAVFLITDGFSNGGDPRPEARALREKGVKIFTFGIRNGNVKELHHMASDPKNETCYILDSFEEFEAMARRALHEDLHSGRYLFEKRRKCGRLCETGSMCCDDRANCMCGTYTGQYQCVCPAGHYGSGLVGDCIPCPSGTYKPRSIPGSDVTCLQCPDENHITEPGSTNVKQCTCRTGFRSVDSNKCAVLQCPVLSPPDNGYFVQDQCDSVFNAACGIRCHPGYELHGSSLRICLENGSWTGTKPECRLKTCPPLISPKNGNMICTRDDFSYKTICRFTCDEGYKLVGSRKRSCLAIAFWTGITTRCREITCQPLPKIKDGKVLPELCTDKEVFFGITCHMSCHLGYTLVGPHTKLCTPEGTWTPESGDHLNECVDTRAPLLFCPPDIDTEADAEQESALITWQSPVAIDNSGYIPSISAVPAVISPSPFPIGVTIVNYTAEDLNKNQASCSFTVRVVDKEPPRIDRCVSPPTFITKDQYANVTWDEPIFSDNSQEAVTVTSSHEPGSFPHGEFSVVFVAVDKFGNNNTCTLTIDVKEHKCVLPKPPVNGNHTCQEDSIGVKCKLSCMKGYDFAMPAADEYFCKFEDGVWLPEDKLPFPDCSVGKVSKDATKPATVTFMGQVSCRERRILHRMEQDFEVSVSKRVKDLCTENAVCQVDEVETTCEEDDDFNVLTVKLERTKRDAGKKTRIIKTNKFKKPFKQFYKKPLKKSKDESIITFDFMLEGSVDTTGNNTEDKKRQKALMSNLQTILKVLQEEAEAGMFNINLGKNRLHYENMIFNSNKPKLKCRQGSILKNNVCVYCPVGTFFNVVSDTCESCGQGTYQPKQGTVTCLVCPGNTSTHLNNSRSAKECKAQCLPGSFSSDGLEMCETCDVGFYQPKYAQTSCLPCPVNQTTVWRGKRQVSDCRFKCQPGYVSKTGLEPCLPCPKGTYQSEVGMSACFRCPGDGSTKRSGCSDLRDCEGDWDLQNDPFVKGSFGQTQLPAVPANPCLGNPCKNNGICTYQPPFNFKCECPAGYGGFVCESEIDECKLKPCLNGGECVDRLNDYSCTCATGFTGKKCEKDINDCVSNPCQNGGTCQDQPNGYRCNCRSGFKGVDCEIDVDECESNPCRNKATCIDLEGTFDCKCPDGFEGTMCELNLDECAAKPCRNNATCYDAANGYRCQCQPGFTGKKCEVNIDECSASPCLNGGTCEDGIDSFSCACVPGFGGDRCEDALQSDFNLEFNKGGTTDYARVKLKQDLSQFTLCFWMMSNDAGNYGTPFSYATKTQDNAITLTDYNGFAINVNNEKVVTNVSGNDGKWHHICFSWSNKRGTFKIYRDGLTLDSGDNLATGQIVQGGGWIVIGQEQDSLGGGFSESESFVGKLSGVNLWDVELTTAQIDDQLTNCEEVAVGNVVAWPDFLGQLKGKLKKASSNFCKECPVPQKPNYGSVEYTGTKAGDVATYSCVRGFQLPISRADRRICLVAGEWEDEAPKCQRVTCSRPRKIANGHVRGNRYSFDNRVRYICYAGYKLVGSETQYCNEYGFWENDQPVCEEIVCEIPEISTNTKVRNPKSKYKPGDDVSFYCTPGNKLFTPHDTVTCQQDGNWDKSVPTCDSIRCKNPPKIENGAIRKEVAEYSVGNIAQYTCSYGYKFSTNIVNTKGRIRCLPNGKWEENLPVCEIVTCPEPSAIPNANIKGDERTFLSQVRYTCQEGYKMSGNSVLECVEKGTWDPRPPVCKPVECGRPEALENSIARTASLRYKSTVVYLCRPGYTLEGEKTRKCLANGTWSGSPPRCMSPSCSRPQDIENGQFSGDNFGYGSVVVYTCDQGYRLQGLPQRVCQLYGTWEGSPPTCTRIECITPPVIENGYYTGSTFYYQDTVEYECDDGYDIDGERILTCEENRTWVPEIPVCRPVACPALEELENGQVATEGLFYGNRAEYSCSDGYDIQGDLSRTCTANGVWSGMAPVCVAISCAAPLEVFSGGYNYTDFNIGSRVSYFCDEGYFLTGEMERQCLRNLSWSYEEPRCDPVLCADPLSPVNGRVIVDGKQFGSSVTYECDPGHALEGNQMRNCTAEAEWSGEIPQCQPIKCDSPARVISNGRMIGDNFTYGATVRYECDHGYYSDSSLERSCLADGTWDNPIPVCEIVQCKRPVNLRNGGYDGFVLDYNTTWTATCRDGYVLIGESERTCLSNGTWSGPEPRCRRVDCGALDPVNFGEVTYNKTTYGSVSFYTCDVGFKLSGEQQRVCESNGLWTEPEPVCEPMRCGDEKSVIENGLVTSNGSFFGNVIMYQCHKGFVLKGPQFRRCTENGTWTGEVPLCDIITCSPPQPIQNGFVEWDNFTYKSELRYSCIDGYRLLGPLRRRCSHLGIWSKEEPSCQMIDCGVLYHPVNGAVELVSTNYGANATYTCDRGFTLIGARHRVCMDSGNWSNANPFCEVVQCPDLPSPNYGFVDVTAYTFGANVTYFCGIGYELVGNPTRVCLTSGVWSGVEPECTIVICPEIDPVANGMVHANNYTYGEIVSFSCDTGFELIGDEEIRCLGDKTWDGETSPNCTRIQCPSPGILLNGTIYADNYLLGTVIIYECDEGFKLIGESARICTEEKVWKGEENRETPYCARIQCLPPNRIDNGAITADTYYYGETVEYSCYAGFVLEGSPQRSCQSNGKWSSKAPVCNPIECSAPEEIPHALVAWTKGDTFRDIMEYNCSEGYRLEGYPQRTCLENASWTAPQFECSRIQCQEIFSILNGIAKASSFEYGAEVHISCLRGFNLSGEAVLTCVGEGYWDYPIPVCVEKSCPEPDLIENGRIEGHTTVVGSEIYYHCNEGYRLVGEEILTCHEDTAWDFEPPVCVPLSCPYPESISNGDLMISKNSSHLVFNDIVYYECDEGYELQGEELLTCLQNGEWSSSTPWCSKISCPFPEVMVHGQYFGTNFTYGSTLDYVCDEGYELTGSPVRHCLSSGIWDAPSPNCDPVICRQPVEISNGNITVTTVFYGGVLKYSCEEGYELIGNSSRYCQADRSWSGEEPYCSMQSCPVPSNVEHAKFVTSSFAGDTYNIGTFIEYSCEAGFEIVGSAVLECLPNKVWSGNFPYCVRKTCPRPEGFQHSETPFYVGTVVESRCNSGFVIQGDKTRTCLSNGTWTGHAPDCVRVQCASVSSIPYGKVIGEQFSYESIISFTCDDGYRLLGASTIECLEDGRWNETVPSCFRIQCPAPRQILNGGYTGQTFYAGDEVRYYCNEGYILLGYHGSQCQEDGTWNYDVPWCEPVSCSDPPKVEHATVASPATAVGDKSYYVCEEGYELDGNNVVECGPDGSWIGVPPLCREISCGPLPIILHATTVITRQTLGSRAEYKCSPGYKATGNLMAECLANKTWIFDQDLECAPVDCGPPFSIPNGLALVNDTSYGARAEYECHRGFNPVGGSPVICSETGKWVGTAPVCQRIGCGPPPTTETSIGVFVSLDGLQVTYTCPVNMRLVGASIIVCGEDGVWSDVPPICEPEGCGDPPPVKDRHLQVVSQPHLVTYQCPDGYVLNGAPSIVCLQGVWSDKAPTCDGISCRDIVAPLHSTMTLTGQEVGQSVHFTCDQGYVLIGAATLICQGHGQWNGLEPVCQAPSGSSNLTCGNLPEMPGVLTVPQGFGQGDSVTLQCKSGYVAVGSLKVTCLQDQSWSHPNGHCQRVYCGQPENNDAKNIMLMGRSYYYGDRVVYMCRRGLQPAQSPSILTCQEDGTWDKQAACIAQCKFPCLNGGRCIGNNRCKCLSGFGGLRCETPICILPCLNGGRCLGPYKCQCKPGYTGTRCHKAICNPDCGEGGRCNRPGKCSCLPGYFPPNCEENRWLPLGPVS